MLLTLLRLPNRRHPRDAAHVPKTAFHVQPEKIRNATREDPGGPGIGNWSSNGL